MNYKLLIQYDGTDFHGWQVQDNARTIQGELERVIGVIEDAEVKVIGSGRTDAGVHALQNYFHFDFVSPVNERFVYKMNAILPPDITVRNIHQVPDTAHSRFDAIAREYAYHIYWRKDPFLRDLAFYYPYKMEEELLHQAAAILLRQTNFFAFTKTNTQASNFKCTIEKSGWKKEGEQLVFNIKANRFLRGMVRLLTASMLQVARNRITLQQFENLFMEEEKCGFSVPPQGLYLTSVSYPENYFL